MPHRRCRIPDPASRIPDPLPIPAVTSIVASVGAPGSRRDWSPAPFASRMPAKKVSGSTRCAASCGTRVDAARLLVLHAQVAAGRLLPRRTRSCRDGCAGSALVDLERVHVQVAVGTVARAQAAADAPVLDDDLERVAPADRADRTADHAQRIAALAARGGDQVLVEPQPFADQPRHAVVRVRARPHALVAARALLEIEHAAGSAPPSAPACRKSVIGRDLGRARPLAVHLGALARDLLEAGADVGERAAASARSRRRGS